MRNRWKLIFTLHMKYFKKIPRSLSNGFLLTNIRFTLALQHFRASEWILLVKIGEMEMCLVDLCIDA